VGGGEGDDGGEGSGCGSAVVIFEDILAWYRLRTVKSRWAENNPRTGKQHYLGMVTPVCDPRP